MDEKIDKLIDGTFVMKISQDILNYSQSMKDNCDTYLQARDITINRIQDIVHKLFQARVKLYGSCKTGLALAESDVDLSVIGFEYATKQQLIQAMHTLSQVMMNMAWVTKCK